MNLLRIYNNEDLKGLPSGTWGIKEPGVEWEGGRRTNGECFVVDSLYFDFGLIVDLSSG
jgi:hypothetical protein